ncbi:MAG: ribosome biogenesis GTPase YlqF [Clostridiales bacterium]
MNVQWFPGHMNKTMRLLKENIKLIDVVIELVDARIPFSSTNPEVKNIIGNKPKIIALNKYDLSDEKVLKTWENWYSKKNLQYVYINSLTGYGLSNLKEKIDFLMKDKMERMKKKGIRQKSIRTMIIGIPNVGKSSFINKLGNKNKTKTGDRPGITRTNQWIRLNDKIEILDTPGILWPKFEKKFIGLNLAFTGAIKDEIMDIETLSLELIKKIRSIDSNKLKYRYKIDFKIDETDLEIMEMIGKKRGCLISKGEIDYNRTANLLLDDFRSSKIGKFTLETPKDFVVED